MAATKGKASARPTNGPMLGTKTELAQADVLTLGEAAAYLRVSEDDVLRLAHLQELPGRQIGDEWRFLKAGLRDWLCTPARGSGKDAFLALAGMWKEDPDIE